MEESSGHLFFLCAGWWRQHTNSSIAVEQLHRSRHCFSFIESQEYPRAFVLVVSLAPPALIDLVSSCYQQTRPARGQLRAPSKNKHSSLQNEKRPEDHLYLYCTMSADDGKKAANAGKKDGPVALCASCDRCRSRKTKCDGNRPCGNCATKYMKKNKLTR